MCRCGEIVNASIVDVYSITVSNRQSKSLLSGLILWLGLLSGMFGILYRRLIADTGRIFAATCLVRFVDSGFLNTDEVRGTTAL